MSRLVRALVAATLAAGLAAGPLTAQETGNSAASSGPQSPGNATDIGPGELSNFSLGGTVTRPTERPAATPTQPQPATAAPPAAARPSTSTSARPVASATTAGPAASPPASDLLRRPPSLPDAASATTIAATPPITDLGPTTSEVAPLTADGFSPLPWIVALLAAAGLGVILYGRSRRHNRGYAAASQTPIDIVRERAPMPMPVPTPAPRAAAPPQPKPDPAPLASGPGVRRPLPTTLMPRPAAVPTPAPKADPTVPGGIVSTGLRPWIDVELVSDRALLDEDGAAIAFEVTLFNSGSAAARDVVIEARLLNAGHSQDSELSAFFTEAATVGDPIPQIIPFARIPLRSAVRLPKSAIREYEYEGRKLFMPLVAISVRYAWSSGSGQTAAGFLVGQGAAGQEKLAPLRLDRGNRSWKGLGVRRYEKGLRN